VSAGMDAGNLESEANWLAEGGSIEAHARAGAAVVVGAEILSTRTTDDA
jgi:hypothetical protein